MSKNIFNKKTVLAIAVAFACIPSYAQSGALTGYSPYSMFGVGDLMMQGSAFNKGMGGIGIATRNRKFINTLNPASVTARDTLSFMVDFGLYQNNRVFIQNDMKSANNTFNINDLVMSFPLYKSSAMMIGLTPYSSTGFSYGSYAKDDEGHILGQTGSIYNSATCGGTINQFFAAAAVTFWHKLSIGLQGTYYFGTINKNFNLIYSNEEYASVTTSYDIQVGGFSGKAGLQFEQRIGSLTLGLGATYTLPANLTGLVDYASSVTSTNTFELDAVTDTIRNGALKTGDQLGVGISVRSGERWRAEINYTRSDWTKSGMDSYYGFKSLSSAAKFTTSVSQAVRAGFEIIPNMNDIRYYHRRWSYRAGVYYEDSYYKVNGQQIGTVGVTLGVTLPIFRLSNGFSVGIEVGQRGLRSTDPMKERFLNFSFSLNAYDIWFQKHRYN